MRFAVGYQLFQDDYLIKNIIERKENISEVYFSWGDFPNGRNNQLKRADMTEWEALEKQMEDLKKLTEEKISLNLLLNATCYGKDSQSRAFFQKVGDTVDYVLNNYILKSVTTTSPLIAKFIKTNFPMLDVRASVNMGIGSVEGMDYVGDFFDSFYLKREYNRNFKKIRELKAWCDENGKKLYMLANSGCLNNCSVHSFHDNLVSHESEISKMDNGYEFSGVCHEYLKKPGKLSTLFDNTGFVRPEDIYLYEKLFSSVKLATRVNANPVMVMKAYIDNKKHIGSVFDLLEPNHTVAIYPKFVENSRIEAVADDDELKYINIEKALINVEDKVCYQVK